jgi:hypothetical protein
LVSSIGQLSFKLHAELASQFDGPSNWGYAPSTATSFTLDASQSDAVGGSGEDWLFDGKSRAEVAGAQRDLKSTGLSWIARPEGSELDVISQNGSTAQM